MTIGPSSAVCAVCSKPKHSLRRRNSKLIPTLKMLVCETCVAGKKEPRWAIILIARRDGVEAVQDVVKNNRYVGDPIMLGDLV